MNQDRRKFLFSLVFVLGTLVAPLSARSTKVFSRTFSSQDIKKLTDIISSFAMDRHSLVKIGEKYSTKYERNMDVPSLLHSIFHNWSDKELQADDTKIKNQLLEQHKNDYAVGRYVDIDGWIISITEARISQVIYLMDL